MNGKLLTMVILGALAAAPMISFADDNTMKKSDSYVDDATITTKVKAELMKERNLKSLDIKVVTTNGDVNLSGTVPSQKQKEMAETTTKQVEGVKSVSNDIMVDTTKK